MHEFGLAVFSNHCAIIALLDSRSDNEGQNFPLSKGPAPSMLQKVELSTIASDGEVDHDRA